jgi:hypothetical protein
MPDPNTTTNPSKLDAFLQPSDREIDYSKYDAEKQADIRGNVDSGMIDHDAIADVAGAEAIHKILLGDEDLDTGLVEGKQALEIDTVAMRQAIVDDNSYSPADKNKYLRTMQIVESIQNKGFSVIRTDSGRYWIESNENGKREYAINAIQEVADLFDKYVVKEDTPDGEVTPEVTPTPDTTPDTVPDEDLPGSEIDIEKYVPEDISLSSSDMYYLSALGVDLVSTMAGLGVKVTTTAATAGVGYLGGAGISIGGGIASTILGAIGDIKNDNISTGEMWANIGISLGLEFAEGATSVPLGLTKNVLKNINGIKKLIRYGMAVGLVDTAASMEWDRLLSKDGEWTANDYRELATLGQFVLSGVSSYVAGKHGKRVLQGENKKIRDSKVGVKEKLSGSEEFKKIKAEGADTRAKIEAETKKKAELAAKKETDVIDAEIAAKKAEINKATQAEIDAINNKTTKATTEAGVKKFEANQAKKVTAAKEANATKIADLDAEFKPRRDRTVDRYVQEGMNSPEHTSQIKEARKATTAKSKEYVAGLEESKTWKDTQKDLPNKWENYETAVGKKQRAETEVEIYSDAYKAKQKGIIPEGTPKKEAKLIAKQQREIALEHGKKQAAKDVDKRKASAEKKEKIEAEEKKANTTASKVMAKQKETFAELEAKKAKPEGLTDGEKAEYDRLKTSLDKQEALDAKAAAAPKGKVAKLIAKGKEKASSASGKVGSKRRQAQDYIYRHIGMTNDATTSSSIAKVSKQYLSYGTNLTGDRIDKMDLAEARGAAERLGFKKNEIGKYSLRQLQGIIKARMKEDKEKKHIGGKLIQKFSKAGVIPAATPVFSSGLFVRKFQDAGKIEGAKSLTDEQVKGLVKVLDNFAFTDVKQLDNFWETNLPEGVVLTPEQSKILTQAHATKAAELGAASKIELAKANPMSKLKPLLENIKPSDLFMRNKTFVDVPVRRDVIAPVLQARPERNMAGYTGAMNRSEHQPRIDSADSFAINAMKIKFANMANKNRNDIAERNNQYIDQQKAQNLAIANQNVGASASAYNQNVQAANQAADIYSQERVKAAVKKQALKNKQWGQVSNSLQRAAVGLADQRAAESLSKKINSLAGLRQVWAKEYAPRVNAAVEANNPFKVTSIKKSFMDQYNRDPDMLDVDMMNLSDEMKLFE